VGGTVSDSHAVSATEIRGSKIEGGEARKIAARRRPSPFHAASLIGFKQVSTPFTYYVIKSTHNG